MTLLVDVSNMSVIRTAEVMHHIQVAPITNGSKNVRYIENRTPNHAMSHIARERIFFIFLEPVMVLISQAPIIDTYPIIPNKPTGIRPKRNAYWLSWTVLQSPMGPHIASAEEVST